MSTFPEYLPTVTLIPYGLPQFLDFEFVPGDFAKKKFCFAERNVTNEDGTESSRLHCLVRDPESDETVDAVSGEIFTSDDYQLSAAKDLKPWLGQWLPIPFFRESHQVKGGEPIYEKGPTNWARARIIEAEEGNPEKLIITIAFDMQVEPAEDGGYSVALSQEDVTNLRTFSLASKARDNAWFLNEGWVDGWLNDVWKNYCEGRRGLPGFYKDFQAVYIASYLLYLETLACAIRGTKVQLTNPDKDSLHPMDVDLILDIGNSRTTGILIETRVQNTTDLNNSYLLQLRDLDQPEKLYSDPFDTRVEFSKASFGLQNYSKRSGRQTEAFLWPSAVRIGPEANRLATDSACNEGTTGMSSPKRYLWDERDWEVTWRYNSHGTTEEKQITDLKFDVNASGVPACCEHEPRFKGNYLRSQRGNLDPSMESKFSRSSMMMFMLMEIIQHALLTANSPGQRCKRAYPDLPRRLRKIVFTVPAGMPLSEQKIYRRWAEFAVCTLWNAMGWKDYYVPQGKKLPGDNYRNRPQVLCNWDEATCTQLVYVYNEIIRNYLGDAKMFFEQNGRRMALYENKPGIRIATIDMGGGTTDLSVTTYVLENEESSTIRVGPRQEIRDGFNIAGDDVVKTVVREHVIPSIIEQLTAAKAVNAGKVIMSAFGKKRMGDSRKERNLRTQFIREIARPAALALLSRYEQRSKELKGEITFRLAAIFEGSGDTDSPHPLFTPPSQKVIDFFNSYVAKKWPGISFDIMDISVTAKLSKLDLQIENTIKGILDNMCELIRVYGCDTLLLTGRPSCWGAFERRIRRNFPVAQDRIVSMKNYTVGSWYPFADTFGNIQDPKTTVVTGAILCTLAQNSLEGFVFDASKLHLKSTAHYIGELDINGELPDAKVWFEVDVDSNKEQTLQLKNGPIEFSSPIVIGFRQLSVQRWTATRTYRMEFADSGKQDEAQGKTPYKVTLEFNVQEIEDAEENPQNEADKDDGEFRITDITDRFGASLDTDGSRCPIKILLRTLRKEEDEGCWIDTGNIYEG
jgi:hypothetical protein